MGETTTRLDLPYPDSTDGPDGADVPYWLQALAEALDGAATIDLGNLADRPVSTVGSPGVAGRFYVSLDQTPKQVAVDLGTSWLTIYPIDTAIADGSLTTAKYADGSVTSAKIADGTIATGDLADALITAAKIADALKPSQGAANATEALRAIGASAGQVVAGNDARLAIISNGSTGSGAAVLAASPTLTGTPHVPTAAIDTNTDQAASTAFVLGQASQSADGTPAAPGTAARGTSKRYARADHVHPHDTTKASLAGDTFTGNVGVSAATPGFDLLENDAPTHEAFWRVRANAGALEWMTRDDDGTGGTIFMQVERTGTTPDSVDFINADLRSKGMNVHRHAGSGDRHIESGVVSLTDTGAGASAPITFADAFASAPHITLGRDTQGKDVWYTNLTASGFTIHGSGVGTFNVSWNAEGAD